MTPLGSVNTFHLALAIHVATIIATFGVIFARPLIFAVANRSEPRSLPVLHRIEHTLDRWVIAPGVLVVLLSGAYLADKGGHWDTFYVWWGVVVAVLLGVALAAVMIPTARRAEQVVRRDLRDGARGSGRSGRPDEPGALSAEYRALARRLSAAGAILGVLVLITMFFMGVERPL